MFWRLRTRLTLLYGGLFGLVLACIAAFLYPLVSAEALKSARGQLEATSKAFERIETLQISQLRENARISATDFGFRSAVAMAPSDPVTARTALANLHRRIGADIVYLVLPDGAVVSETTAIGLSRELLDQLMSGEVEQGALVLDRSAYRAVATPVLAPDFIGSLLVGARLDDAQMRSLASLTAIPIEAELLVRKGGDWMLTARSSEKTSGDDASVSADEAIVEDRLIASMDGNDIRLQLSFSMEAALAPMRSLLGILLGTGLVGLAILGIAAWFLARSITRPLAALEAATRRIEDGDYSPVRVESRDEVGRLASSFNMMVNAIEERTRTITYQALHDRETDLPNREHFERTLHEAAVETGHIYVAAIGIDRYSQIRDAIGYHNAAALVTALGGRLRGHDALASPARLSGAILGIAFAARSEAEATLWLGETLRALEMPVEVASQSIDIIAKAGFARLSEPGASGHNAIDRACIALDQVRKSHRKVATFDSEVYGDPVANLSLMGDMLRALARGDIYLAHQPKLNLRTGEFEGTEALVRWPHAERGMIRPDVFVPMAEETGRIRELTEWVLAQAVKDQATLAAAGLPMRVSVNISGRLLGDPWFEQMVDRLAGKGLDALCFEITETAVMNDPERAMTQLRHFADRGIPISIDDYGAGLSSLAYLKMMPARELKIDRGLLAGLAANARDSFLLRSTIDLGHGLGMKVVAEGVEDNATLAILQGLGCDMAQGYLISRPVTLPDLIRFLKSDLPRADLKLRASS